MVYLFQSFVQLQHARREEFSPQRFNVFKVKFELIVDNGFIVVGRVEGLESLSNKPTHLVFHIVVEHLNDWDLHFFKFFLERGSVQILNKLHHRVNIHVDVSPADKGKPFPESRLTIFHRNQRIIINGVILSMHYFMIKSIPILLVYVELIRVSLKVIPKHLLQ